ncbi:anti-sigma factor domain-containing protein [Pseudomonas sp. R5(2019)]|uniref:anti-sigma factor n=1 Tax=Pseudomonas sp. R5(2019) TaxID=2697566 RepID=UPI001412534E|nr:anti-sigma factor [Pseudomonas sp. R5(2019)]NBA96277.1 anti-sigma factor [Pseudomonas sp. R5(2019)]
MNYQSPSLRRALAADYSIGLMPPLARKRFERLLKTDPTLRAEVAQWHESLLALTQPLPEEPVPEQVWQAIEARLFPAARKPGLWDMHWLRGAILAAMLSVVVAIGAYLYQGDPLYTTTLVADNQQAVMVVDGYDDYLQIEALKLTSVDADRSLELWAIPADGKPVSLGLLPRQGSSKLELDAGQQAALKNAKALAVSLEPLAGSPTGQPTGPVLYQGVLRSL